MRFVADILKVWVVGSAYYAKRMGEVLAPFLLLLLAQQSIDGVQFWIVAAFLITAGLREVYLYGMEVGKDIATFATRIVARAKPKE